MLTISGAFAVAMCAILLVWGVLKGVWRLGATGYSVRARALYCAGAVLLLIFCFLAVSQIAHTPQALALEDSAMALGGPALLINSVRMDPPSYESGSGFIERNYASTLHLEITNLADKDVYLGVEYYANAGSAGFYSPGATWGQHAVTVSAGTTEKYEVSIQHPRFIRGGHITLTFINSDVPLAQEYQPTEAEALKRTYVMVP
jgi:hypothetical protein